MIRYLKGISQRDSHPQVRMTQGRGVLEKSDKMTWCSRWTPHLWKFSRKSWWAFTSWNQTWRWGVSEEEEDPKPRGFQAGVDLCLSAMHNLCKRERERERENTSQTEAKREKREDTYAWNMHEYVTCKNKYIIGKTQSKPSSTHFNIIKNTSKCMKHC